MLQSGFKNKPPVYYYQGGDAPVLPDELKGMITAELLGPSPKDSDGAADSDVGAGVVEGGVVAAGAGVTGRTALQRAR